jgi:plastocyanin
MRRRANGRAATTIGALLLCLLAAGSVRAADASVTIADLAFAPGTVTITEGDSVTWTNQDGVDHTATGTGFDTEAMGTGESSTISFETAGTFAYACAIHPTMRGAIIVEAAAAAPTATADGGGETAITPAPTDAMPPPDAEPPDAVTLVAALLALAGISMLAGTWWFGRRGRVAAPAHSARPPEDGPSG